MQTKQAIVETLIECGAQTAFTLPGLGITWTLDEFHKRRKDIRVVGDRFVFESEVLFPSGSATLTPEGLAAMDQLAVALADLTKTIPPEIGWALQVDGHTDIRPIASATFPSNWELSTARAVSASWEKVTSAAGKAGAAMRTVEQATAASAARRSDVIMVM